MNDAAPAIRPVDLSGTDTAHPEGESVEHRIGVAAAETAAGVSGVHHLGGAGARALDAASRAIRGTSTGPGVTVAQSDGTTTIDLSLVVEYPSHVQEVVDAVREQVAHAAQQIQPGTVRVNITVSDIHGPFDDEQSPAGAALERAKESGSDALEKAKDAGSQALDRVKDAGSEALEKAQDAGSEAADRTKAIASDASDRARTAGAQALDTAKDVGAEAAERAKAVGAVLADSAEGDRPAEEDGADASPTVVVVDGPVTIEVADPEAADPEERDRP